MNECMKIYGKGVNCGGGASGAIAPQQVFLNLRIDLFWLLTLRETNKRSRGASGGKGYVYMKDC